MSVMAYSWKRRMCLQGVLGKPLGSNIGIVAGSPFAVQELTVIMVKVVEEWRKANPVGCISIHVDDIAISVWGRSKEDIQDKVLHGVSSLDKVVEEGLGMKFSKEKTYIVQSHPSLVDGLVSTGKWKVHCANKGSTFGGWGWTTTSREWSTEKGRCRYGGGSGDKRGE